MRTLTLVLILAAPAAAQPPAAPPPAPTAAPTAGGIIPEAQSIFDRAIAAYRAAKGYRESVVTTLRQKASGLPKDSEPPADQASTTTFTWSGPDRFVFDTRDFGLYRDGKQSTILVKSLGEYTQRETTEDDKRVFANMVDMNPVYQVLAGAQPGQTVGRFATVTGVESQELRGVKGKRLTGTGLPPLPGFEILSPMTMFFADDTGLLVQSTFDLKAAMQAQIDRSRAATPGLPKVTIDEFLIISDWSNVKVDVDPAGEQFTFKPAAGDRKVDDFNMTDGDTSVQHTLLNTSAPDFTATTLDGKPVSLKDLKGKVVLLQFWATATGTSTRALAAINSLNSVYAERGVVVLGVNMDHATMTEQSKRVAAAKLAAYPQIADPDKAIGNAYRVTLVPCTILIDKEGVIRSISSDVDAAAQTEIADRLESLLKGAPLDAPVKPAPPAPPGVPAPQTPPDAPVTPPPADAPRKP